MKVKKLAGILAIVVLMTSVLCISASAATEASVITETWTGYLDPLVNNNGYGGSVYARYVPGSRSSQNASIYLEYQNHTGPKPNDVELYAEITGSNGNIVWDDEMSVSSTGWKNLSFGGGGQYSRSVYYEATGYGNYVYFTLTPNNA